MNFSIRNADKIVGAFVILALAILVFVIFMLGTNQRWFVQDQQYSTYFTSATGISPNMAIQYRGFNIGQVKGIVLTDNDNVEVFFTIFEEYSYLVKDGSVVEIQSSPIPGLGSTFIFHPGNGVELIPAGGFIPEINTPQARALIARGAVTIQRASDNISNIINQVGMLLETLNISLAGSHGVEDLTLGQILLDVGKILADVGNITESIAMQINPLVESLSLQLNTVVDTLLIQIDSFLANINDVMDTVSVSLSGSA